MQRWEYKQIGNDGDEISIDYLNRLGENGWELAIGRIDRDGDLVDAILKRPLEPFTKAGKHD
jgi:hypothetical protein